MAKCKAKRSGKRIEVTIHDGERFHMFQMDETIAHALVDALTGALFHVEAEAVRSAE